MAEGRNLSIEYRFARGALELPDLAAELLRLPGDVIFSETGTAAKAAVRATRVIPIVFSTGDALAEGLTSGLARPDRNATGLSVVTIYTTAKKLELLKRGSPRRSRIAVMRCPEPGPLDEQRMPQWQRAKQAADRLHCI